MAILDKDDIANKIGEQLVGRRKEISLILAAVRSGTPIMIEGEVGRGKTKVSLEVAKSLGRAFFRVDGAPDISVQKIVGWFDPSLVLIEVDEAEKRGIKPGFSWDTFIPGPLTEAMMKGGILFVNEGTRLPSDTWNALLTAMDEKIVVIPKLGIIEAKPGFSIIVTANPTEHAGAYPLPEAAADRFVWVPMNRQDLTEEQEIIRRELQHMGYPDISMNEGAINLIAQCIDQTYNHPDLITGVSVRAGIQMGCMLAELGGDFHDKNLVLQVALMAFQKKLKLKDNVTKTREEIINEIVDTVFHNAFNDRTRQPDTNDPFSRKNDKSSPSNEEQFEEERVNESDQDETINKKPSSQPLNVKAKREARTVKSISREHPEKIASHLNSDPEYVKDVQGADPEGFLEVFHRIRPWLHEKVYDLILHTYSDTILRKAEEIYLTGTKTSAITRINYESGRGEVDWDETIDQYTETIEFNKDTIVMKEPIRVQRSLVLLMDHSGSMAGRKILTAALCTGVLAYTLKNEEFAVLLFNNEVQIPKELDIKMDLNRLIIEVLEQQPQGFTDIKSALEVGLKQLAKASHKVKLGILITDGIHTASDPIGTAEKYSTLHVLGVPSIRGKVINVENCKRLAEAGKGKFLMLRDYAEVPQTILKLLT